MTIPLAIAAPAAVASLAYLSARTQFQNDFSLIKGLVYNGIHTARAQKTDRVNRFYALEDHAQSRSTANHPFIVYEGKSYTYKETYNIVLKYAAWLKTEYSIAPKEIVALDFMNSPKFVFIWLAIWSLGANPALINYNLTSEPLLHCVRTSTARIIFFDDEIEHNFSDSVRSALQSSDFRDGKGPVEMVRLDAAMERVVMSTDGIREPDSSRAGADNHQMAILIYTSGTTGNPKPAIIPWVRTCTGGDILHNWMGLKKSDRFYTCMPLYHSTATILGLLPCLHIGSTLILGHKFSNKTFWPEVRGMDATIIQYVGETCRYLLTAPPQTDPTTGEDLDKKNNVRIAFGNGLRPDVWQKFKDRFEIDTIAEFYGATEGASASWNFSSNEFSRGAIGRFGTLGRLLMKKKQAIVELDWETETARRDPENSDFCTKVQLGSPGELLYAVDPAAIHINYQGYFNNEKATSSKIMRDVFTKGDAWFRTGDVARFDSEGRLWFSDRIGDTFRWKSENVSTNEVAEVVGHHPAIVDANVYGVELPNHDGRAGAIAVVFNRPADQNLMDSLAAHAHEKLPRYAVPLFLRVTKEAQATGNNKQQKHVLKKEGVDPDKVHVEDRLFWLRNGTYTEFTKKDWQSLHSGEVKL
ncbi:hypothetical protein MMC19_006986 [Ptychographa xylographoides]|nr:hypothetical protein [Ptychographa xylographoides]